MFSGRTRTATFAPAGSGSQNMQAISPDEVRTLAVWLRNADCEGLPAKDCYGRQNSQRIRNSADGRFPWACRNPAICLRASPQSGRRLREGFRLVVSDIDRGDAGFALQALEFDPHLLAQLGIEIGERFIQQQQARFPGERARQRQPLLLPAGKLRCGT